LEEAAVGATGASVVSFSVKLSSALYCNVILLAASDGCYGSF
jgi:hypothetical protein